MKVVVWYALGAEVDIPKEEIEDALSSEDHDIQGQALGCYALKHSPELENWLRSAPLRGTLTGVYNPTEWVDGSLLFVNDDYDEVIWED